MSLPINASLPRTVRAVNEAGQPAGTDLYSTGGIPIAKPRVGLRPPDTLYIASTSQLPPSNASSGTPSPGPLTAGWYIARVIDERDVDLDPTAPLTPACVGNSSTGALVYARYLPEVGATGTTHALQVNSFQIGVPADVAPDGRVVYNIGAAGSPGLVPVRLTVDGSLPYYDGTTGSAPSGSYPTYTLTGLEAPYKGVVLAYGVPLATPRQWPFPPTPMDTYGTAYLSTACGLPGMAYNGQTPAQHNGSAGSAGSTGSAGSAGTCQPWVLYQAFEQWVTEVVCAVPGSAGSAGGGGSTGDDGDGGT